MADHFTLVLRTSLQELHNKLLFEYQRTWHGSSEHNIDIYNYHRRLSEDDWSSPATHTLPALKSCMEAPPIPRLAEEPVDNFVTNASLPRMDKLASHGSGHPPSVADALPKKDKQLLWSQSIKSNGHNPRDTLQSFTDGSGLKGRGSEGSKDGEESSGMEFEVHEAFVLERPKTKGRPGATQVLPSPTKMTDMTEGMEEAFADAHVLDCLVCRPASKARLYWELFGATLVLFALLEIPLQLSFEPPDTALTLTMAWIARIYWLLDCVSLFFVGYTSDKGTIVLNLRLIRRHYLRTWFPLDIFVVCCDWFDYVSKQVGVSGATQGLLVLRMAKLLRIGRIMTTLPQVLDSMFASKESSEGVQLILGVLKDVFAAAVVLHMIACSWHAIGKHSLRDSSGWLHRTFYGSSVTSDTSFLHIYLVSYYWSITQLIGSPDVFPNGSLERAFAILVLFLALIISASVVSSITTSMTAIQFISSQKEKQLDRLRKYLISHNIQSATAHRVLQNAMHALEEGSRNVHEGEVELLRLISEPLYIELHHEMYKEYLDWHPFFSHYMTKDHQAVRQVCHVCLTQHKIHKGDRLFSNSEQKLHPQTYFLLSGKMVYAKHGESAMYIAEGQWAAEHVLWTSWTHRGTLCANQHCNILCIDSGLFQNTVKQFKATASWPAAYAIGFVALLNELDEEDLTDVDDEWILDVSSLSRSIFEEEEEGHRTSRRRTTLMSFLGLGTNSTITDGLRTSGEHHGRHRIGTFLGRASVAASIAFGLKRQDSQPLSKSAQRAAEVGAEAAHMARQSCLGIAGTQSTGSCSKKHLKRFGSSKSDGIDEIGPLPSNPGQLQLVTEIPSIPTDEASDVLLVTSATSGHSRT